MEVIDEPLYANFLRVTGIERPYRDELLSKMVRATRTCYLIFKPLLSNLRVKFLISCPCLNYLLQTSLRNLL